jgi:ribosome production factor 1
MGKKKADASLKGKKPENTAKRGAGAGTGAGVTVKVQRNPGHIANKLKRSEVYGKYLEQKRALKKETRLQREKEAEALGEQTQMKKQTPKTIDNTRELEPTMVLDDPEVAADEDEDEFAPYFFGEKPKVLITTRPRPSQSLFHFIADPQKLIPALHFYPRKSYSVKEICTFAANREFTHLIVLSEKSKACNGMTISHLRLHDGVGKAGPTAFFKVSNVITSKNIPNHGASTSHIPELNLHGFGTRLGHRVGRLLGSIFPHDAQFQGRQVVTFHNQRDYLFVRHHRYIFKEDAEKTKKLPTEAPADGSSPLPPVKTRLQELGPRFTLKLRWLQEGTFDTQHGEYEWIHKRKEMDSTRRKFHL